MNVSTGRRVGLLLALPLCFYGCAICGEAFRANVTIAGVGVVTKNGVFSANIDKLGEIFWHTTCDGWKEIYGVMFPIVPLPPIFPLGNVKPLETAKQPFSVFLESKNGRQQDKNRLRASLLMGGTKTFLPMEYETYYGVENTRWAYKFSSQFTCGDIRDAEFRLENILLDGIVLDPFLYRLDYQEGVVWE